MVIFGGIVDMKQFQAKHSKDSITYRPSYEAGRIGIILFLLLGILFIILSPFLLLGFLSWFIVMPFITFSNWKSYKKSEYYKAFKKPFSNKIFDSNEYAFYNYAIEEKLPIKYVKQTNKDLK